jgi:hypothetical protein
MLTDTAYFMEILWKVRANGTPMPTNKPVWLDGETVMTREKAHADGAGNI